MINILNDDKTFKKWLPLVATKEFLSSKSDEYGWFVSENFILPYIIEKKFIFKRIVFTYSVIKKEDGDEKEFLNGVVELARGLNIDFVYQPYAFAIFNEVPDGAIFTKFGTYQVNLAEEEEKLFLNLHSKHRNVIRKAKKNGLEIFEGVAYKNECYELIKDTLVRQKQPYMSLVDIDKMLKKLKENISFFVIKNEETIEGSAIILWNQYEAYYLLAGSARKTSAGAMNLLVWEIMLNMKKKHVQQFDFVGARLDPVKGSKFEGIQRFKSRFGTTLKKGYLWKFPLRPFRYQLFRLTVWLFYKIKRKVYMGDIIDQELRNG